MPGWNLNPTPISEHLNLLISFNHMKQEDDGPKYTEVLQVLWKLNMVPVIALSLTEKEEQVRIILPGLLRVVAC